MLPGRIQKQVTFDTIDLNYLHRYSGNAPFEEIGTILQRFIQEDKIKNYGLSEISAETMRKAHGIEPITALQSEYHLMWREPENNVFPVWKEPASEQQCVGH